MDEDGLDELVCVESPSLRQISSDQCLSMLDCQLGSLVSPGIVSSGDSVDNSPL